MRQAAQGSNKESVQPNQGRGRGPMYFGSPGLALILVVSAAPMEKTVEGVELVANITDPLPCVSLPMLPGAYLGVEVSAHGLLGPRLEVELSSALFLWVTHHVGHGLRWWGGERQQTFSFLHACHGLNCTPPNVLKS